MSNYPIIQLSPLEQETYSNALRASTFDNDHRLAEQIDRDQGRLPLTEENTANILNTFDSGPEHPDPDHMKDVVEHARTEYERRRYENINIDSAGEDDIRRRLDAQELKAAAAEEGFTPRPSPLTEAAESRLADVRGLLARPEGQDWQADDLGYANQTAAGEQHRL